VVDQGLTKGVILLPCTETITTEGVAKLLLENLYKRFGLPDKIISDQGPQFASKAFIELLKLLGIHSALSTAYHPQTDGMMEQVNQKIGVPLDLLHVTPRRMGNDITHDGVHPQQSKTCRSTRNPI
jgi:transposase InsO family protein